MDDFDAQVETDFPLLEMFSANDIAQGGLCTGGSSFCNFNRSSKVSSPIPTAHLALYNLGVYAQDEWQVIPRLKLTIGARFWTGQARHSVMAIASRFIKTAFRIRQHRSPNLTLPR